MIRLTIKDGCGFVAWLKVSRRSRGSKTGGNAQGLECQGRHIGRARGDRSSVGSWFALAMG